MQEQVKRFIAEHGLLTGDGPVLVGVSGGIDSMTTLHVLRELGYPVICAHFDHRLRPGSRADRDLVQAAAQSLRVPFVEGSGDVRSFQSEGRLGLEAAARSLRYRFLFGQAVDLHARAVVTGHTADDQVETVFMHLLRGAGLRGMKGMAPRTVVTEFDPEIPLVRPLLGAWREQVVQYREQVGFAYIEDESNQDLSLFRNRVRHDLIPYLAGSAPNLRTTVLRTAQALAADDAVLEQAAGEAWAGLLLDRADDWIEFDLQAFSTQPVGIQARLLRRGIAALRSEADALDFDTARRGIALVGSRKSTGSCDLLGGLKLIREYGRLWLAAEPADLPDDRWPQLEAEVQIAAVPATVSLAGKWVLTIEPGPGSGPAGAPGPGEYGAVLDRASLRFPLLLRGRSTGERFEPQGMAGRSKRLSDAMIDWKIPRRLRQRWPLLVSGGKVAWVPGFRIGEGFAAGSETAEPVCLSLFQR